MPDPYKDGLLGSELPFTEKSPVVGRLVCILYARHARRGLELCPYPSRAVLKNEIHELILTDETEAAPGKTVNQIAYLAFFEITQGGVLWAGDVVEVNGQSVGTLAGYDLTHFPNHMNIVVKTGAALNTGHESGWRCGDEIVFRFEMKVG